MAKQRTLKLFLPCKDSKNVLTTVSGFCVIFSGLEKQLSLLEPVSNSIGLNFEGELCSIIMFSYF